MMAMVGNVTWARRFVLLGDLLVVALIVLGVWLYPPILDAPEQTEVALITMAAIILVYAALGAMAPEAIDGVESDVLRWGMIFGLAVGLALTVQMLHPYILPEDAQSNTTINGILGFAVNALFLVAGVLGARTGAGVRGGLLASAWSAVVGSLVFVNASMIACYAFAGTPQGDQMFLVTGLHSSHGESGVPDLRAYVMLTLWESSFFHMLFSPILAALIGALAGLVTWCVARLTWQPQERIEEEGSRWLS